MFRAICLTDLSQVSLLLVGSHRMLAMSHATGTKTRCVDIERRGAIEDITLSRSQ